MLKIKKMSYVFLIVIMFIGIFGVFFQAGAATSNEKIDVNTASVEELTEIKGVGPVIAERIVDYRENNGAFSAPEDLGNVKGLGPKTISEIKSQIVFGPASD
ncbi:MAG: ComEA family DNA-binding protein [Desulfobacterales bacterium]